MLEPVQPHSGGLITAAPDAGYEHNRAKLFGASGGTANGGGRQERWFLPLQSLRRRGHAVHSADRGSGKRARSRSGAQCPHCHRHFTLHWRMPLPARAAGRPRDGKRGAGPGIIRRDRSDVGRNLIAGLVWAGRAPTTSGGRFERFTLPLIRKVCSTVFAFMPI